MTFDTQEWLSDAFPLVESQDMDRELRTEGIGIRVTRSERAQMDARAAQYGLTFTDFIVRAALDQLPDGNTTLRRLDAIEERLDLLEKAWRDSSF